MPPIVSIIIPVYNRPVLVSEAIESVLAQTNPNWELIVVDDGSTDNTWEVLESYAAKDKRIRVFKRDREPKGAPTCRNIGAGLAKGEYLIFWDSDDLLFPWCVEDRLEYIKDNPALDFAVFPLLSYYEEQEKFVFPNPVNSTDYLLEFLNFNIPWGTPGVIWVRSSFYKLTGWNEKALSWQDPELHIRGILIGLSFKMTTSLPDGLYQSLMISDRVYHSGPDVAKFLNRLEIFESIFDLLNEKQKKVFSAAVKKEIWKLSLNYRFSEIKKIAAKSNKLGLLKDDEKRQLSFSFFLYSIIKRYPLIRRPIYKRIETRVKENKSEFNNYSGESELLKQFLSKLYPYKNDQSTWASIYNNVKQ